MGRKLYSFYVYTSSYVTWFTAVSLLQPFNTSAIVFPESLFALFSAFPLLRDR